MSRIVMTCVLVGGLATVAGAATVQLAGGGVDVVLPLVLHVPSQAAPVWVDSEPEMDGTLPRVGCNVILLTFDAAIALPEQGAPLEVVTLPDGPDVSDHFIYSVMPDGVTLCAEEVDPLPNQTWYRVVSAPGLDVVPFMLDVCTLWGDVDFSGRVTTADYSVVKAHMGEVTSSPCQYEPWDLNCSGRVTTSDYAIIKDHMGDRKPPKPLPGTLVNSYPPADGMMPTECRTLLLEFNSAISLPAEGPPLSVVSLHDATDVSDGYTYSVLADGRTLCAEWNALMVNQQWYQVAPAEGFDVEPFVLDVCTLLGHLNGNCIVEESEGAGILERMDQARDPCTQFPWDLNCSGRVTTVDYTLLLAHVGEQCPAKP
ncbi:MAG TPA: dockerin type I repeat-containing protein [Phycisphaerae bacterium]|nr:dockerin type I repeat-containing protein [Phycisphaerae bacterium]